MTAAQRALEKWRRDGVARDDVAEVAGAPAALHALESARGIVLPESFRELWTLSDGTGAMDADGFLFWPLDNIASDPSLGAWRGLLVFADLWLGPPHFCLRFDVVDPASPGGARAGAVVRDSGEEVAASFDDFLERYLLGP
jgi:hypothetical protein